MLEFHVFPEILSTSGGLASRWLAAVAAKGLPLSPNPEGHGTGEWSTPATRGTFYSLIAMRYMERNVLRAKPVEQEARG